MNDVQPGAPDEAQAAAHEDGQGEAQPGASSDSPAAADPAPDPATEHPEEQVQPGSATTADPRVDDALSRLGELDALPLTEQVEVYTDIHRRLAAVLSDPDSQA